MAHGQVPPLALLMQVQLSRPVLDTAPSMSLVLTQVHLMARVPMQITWPGHDAMPSAQQFPDYEPS